MQSFFKKTTILILAAVFCLSGAGCETLRKKFTRKRKKSATEEIMIVSPRDYSAHPFPNDVLYKQYFVYWKSWNQELAAALSEKAPQKKVLDCAQQAMINLKKMQTYLREEKAAELAGYIQQTQALADEIAGAKALLDPQRADFRTTAERILSQVNRKFDAKKMKDFLK